MKDKDKTKGQLLSELAEMRRQVEAQTVHKQTGAILESISDGVFTVDMEWRITSFNRAAEEIMGLSRKEALGRRCSDVFRSSLCGTACALQQTLKTGKPIIGKSGYIIDADENRIPISISTSRLHDAEGRGIGGAETFRDLSGVLEESAVVEAINQVFREALTCETEEDLARTCLRVAEELTGSRFGFIGEINLAGRFDTVALSDAGWEACQLPQSEAAVLIKDMEIRGLWGAVLKEEQALIVNDPASHPASVGTPEGHPGVASFLGVPLKRGGKTMGMIALGNKERGYEVSDQEAVETLAVAVVEALMKKRAEQKLAQQAQEILELSTPVLQVWEGVVVAPLIGMLDSVRTQRFMERFLDRIVETNSSVALVDITGVPAIDTQTAQHLLEAITAARLLGTQVILTGVQPAIAQTVVHLGIDLSEIETCTSLGVGLRLGLKMLDSAGHHKNQQP